MDIVTTIDEALKLTAFRDTFTSTEVADLLLDLRSLAVDPLVPAAA